AVTVGGGKGSGVVGTSGPGRPAATPPSPGPVPLRPTPRGQASIIRKARPNTPTWNHMVRTSEATKSCRTALTPAPATIWRTVGESTTPAGGLQDAGVMVGSEAAGVRARGRRLAGRGGGGGPGGARALWQARAPPGLQPGGVLRGAPRGQELRWPRRCDGVRRGPALAAEQREEDHADHRDAH